MYSFREHSKEILREALSAPALLAAVAQKHGI
jgi:hypothetical protein